MREESEKDLQLTDFDYLLADPKLQMMKAALPYLAPTQQRIISLFIKFQELNRARTLFQGQELSAMSLNASQKSSPVEMLQAIKPYAGPKERELIETLENLQLMLQAIQL